MGDIDTVVVDSLKALDLERPIREADISTQQLLLRVTIRAWQRSQLTQMRGRTMQRLKHPGGILVDRESLEANPPSLIDKAGNCAGVGEYGLIDVQ